MGDRITIVGDIYPGNLRVHHARHLRQPAQPAKSCTSTGNTSSSRLPERRRGNVGMFYILIDDPGALGQTIAVARSMPVPQLAASQTKTETEHAFTVGFLSLLGQRENVPDRAFAPPSLFTILLVSANTMAMSVRERVREVGVLKTLGFTRGRRPRHDSRRGAVPSRWPGGLIGYLHLRPC